MSKQLQQRYSTCDISSSSNSGSSDINSRTTSSSFSISGVKMIIIVIIQNCLIYKTH